MHLSGGIPMTKSWNFEVCGNNVVSPFDHLVMYWVLGCAVLMLPILVPQLMLLLYCSLPFACSINRITP